MAKRTPLTFQEERLQRLTRNAELKIVALKEMIDTAAKIVIAQSLEVGTPAQVIEVSEEGGLDLGGARIPWWDNITIEASHTGDTDETELGKITVPGDSMGANGFVRIFASFRAMGAGTHIFRIYFGGVLFSLWSAATTNYMLDITTALVWNRDATDSQGSGIADAARHVKNTESAFSAAIDTTAAVDITLTGQNVVGADTVYLRKALVEAFYKN